VGESGAPRRRTKFYSPILTAVAADIGCEHDCKPSLDLLSAQDALQS
jgi:hypothetical protein